MGIKKYTNFENINLKTENEGKFLNKEDIFIVTKNEIEGTEFGECKYDVMEVAVYDINNNLLPQKSGRNVSYIKTNDIKNYLYNVTNVTGLKEIAINIEKLLKDLGFTNGILKVNINFVRNSVGSDDILNRVWIQEISPSREEVRIIPLKVKDEKLSELNKKEFSNLNNLNKDFSYYKKTLLDTLNSFENNFLTKVDDYLESKYGKDFFNILKKDFGLSRFDNFRKKIFDDFKISVNYYLTNKNYNINDYNFGKPSELRFEDCERYNFSDILNGVEDSLYNCIEHNSSFLKRRSVKIEPIPEEFKIVELEKEIQNLTESFPTPVTEKVNIYTPSDTNFKFDDTITKNTDIVILDPGPINPGLEQPMEEPIPRIPDIVILDPGPVNPRLLQPMEEEMANDILPPPPKLLIIDPGPIQKPLQQGIQEGGTFDIVTYTEPKPSVEPITKSEEPIITKSEEPIIKTIELPPPPDVNYPTTSDSQQTTTKSDGGYVATRDVTTGDTSYEYITRLNQE